MTKTDKSKHSVCIASIKRATMKPYDFKWTKFYESNLDFTSDKIQLDLIQNELIICSTVLDSNNYSILTTQRLFTRENGNETIGSLINSKDKSYGDFKSLKYESLTFGLIELENGSELKYFIETGKASMIMIYGLRTIIKLHE